MTQEQPHQQINLTTKVNGKEVAQKVFDSQTVADFLQEDLGLSGTKVCCGLGVCKACTVALKRPDEKIPHRIQACITPISILQGAELTTVEGLSQGDKLHPLQEAFLQHFSFQCGYSTPGFLMGGYLLLEALKRSPIAKEDIDKTIEENLGDHICRCSGYKRYHKAIREVILNFPGLTK